MRQVIRPPGYTYSPEEPTHLDFPHEIEIRDDFRAIAVRDPHRSSLVYVMLDLELITTAKPPLRGEELEQAVDRAVELTRDSFRELLAQGRRKVKNHP